MKPPNEINIADQHGSFCAITRAKAHVKTYNAKGQFSGWKAIMRESGMLLRPCRILKKSTIGILQSYAESSFYQNNNNVTRAIYKVKGYGYRIAVWFDNATGKRIA